MKTCPLVPRPQLNLCREDGCAWWDENTKRCAVFYISWISKMAQFLAETVDAMAAGDGGVCVHVVDDDEGDAQAAAEGLEAYQTGDTIPWEQVKVQTA